MHDPTLTPPPLFLAAKEARVGIELIRYFLSLKSLRTLPKGDGHPVLIIPGFMASDLSTFFLRKFLHEHNYNSHKWKYGQNRGYSPRVHDLMEDRLEDLCNRYQQRISIIGWSLGGMYAREIARTHPDCVRQIITLGSPFARSWKANNVVSLYDKVAHHKVDDVPEQVFRVMQEPTGVPTTAIYTIEDGVVNWETCKEVWEDDITENIRVYGTHCGLVHNPSVFNIIGNRLLRDRHNWSRMYPLNEENANVRTKKKYLSPYDLRTVWPDFDDKQNIRQNQITENIYK